MYYLMMPSFQKRQDCISFLKSRRILSVFHYVPLHLSPMGIQFGGQKKDCPVTEDKSDCLLRLPFYNSLSRTDQNQVIEAILNFHE
jgi:dTDP-4-amino-4,6-dideoxygalactose transaminase